MNFEITPAAEKFIRMMLRIDGGPGSGFRLAVTPWRLFWSCRRYQREPAPEPGEAVVDRNGIKLFLPAESRILLDGVTIDFAETHVPDRSGVPRSEGEELQLALALGAEAYVGGGTV